MFHLLTILMFFNLVSGSCCHKVSAVYSVKNNAYDQNPGGFGNYTMQAGFVNGKAHFLIDIEIDTAIWYDGDGNWFVGLKSEIGKSMGRFNVESTADCPYTPAYTWKYVDQYNNWRDADEGFSIWCDS